MPAPYKTRTTFAALLRDTQRRLQLSLQVDLLLARAAEEARPFCGAERALVLRLRDGQLTAAGIGAIAHAPSDVLRRTILAEPVVLVPGTPEAEAVRHAEGSRETRPTQPSALGAVLGLRRPLVAAIAPEGRALALVTVDRAEDTPEADALEAVQLFAHLVGCALDHAVHRNRMSELTDELRHLTTSATALMQEAAVAPLSLPEDYGNGPVFRQVSTAPSSCDDVRALLTDREVDVLDHLVDGLSNRQIGERLCLAPPTIKDHVARILSKLGAANRVDAVGIYLGVARRG